CEFPYRTPARRRRNGRVAPREAARARARARWSARLVAAALCRSRLARPVERGERRGDRRDRTTTALAWRRSEHALSVAPSWREPPRTLGRDARHPAPATHRSASRGGRRSERR